MNAITFFHTHPDIARRDSPPRRGQAPDATADNIAEPDRHRLIRDHMALVARIAAQVHRRCSASIERADLVQIGMTALVEAANAYRDCGHAFSSYAGLRVRGAMIDHLRRSSGAARSAARQRRDFAATRHAVEAGLGRPATVLEMADAMGIPVAEYHKRVAACQPITHLAIDSAYDDRAPSFADKAPAVEEQITEAQRAACLRGAMAQLPEREALVLDLYFAHGRSLDDIARHLGVGAARVCQIKREALLRLRGLLAGLV
jgi:RNA polymerase sigma factor for flagellar operon FliA